MKCIKCKEREITYPKYSMCKPCYCHIWRERNKEDAYDRHKKYREKRFEGKPWLLTLEYIKRRCRPNGPYTELGIRCRITAKELRKLWVRDNAECMEQPSIDRVNTKGDYCVDNCRYIELIDNQKRKRRV